jgi:hypothetical protein
MILKKDHCTSRIGMGERNDTVDEANEPEMSNTHGLTYGILPLSSDAN